MAAAVAVKGMLILTIYYPDLEAVPTGFRAVVTLGVARAENDGDHLLKVLTDLGALDPLAGVDRPAAPWSTSYRWPRFERIRAQMQWLDEFEQALTCAWAGQSGSI